MNKSQRLRLSVEFLEAREVPTANPITETFDTTAPPSLPSGWTRWSNDGSAAFTTSSTSGVTSSVGLVSNAGSATSALAWSAQAVGRDDSVSAMVYADSLIRSFVFTRGTNLGTQTPSYLAAVVTRGLNVQLWEVNAGNVRVLGALSSPNASYLSSQWVQVSLVPTGTTGTTVAIQVKRSDTGQYLNASGSWQSTATNALSATTALTTTSGFAGLGRAAAYSGTAKLDTFSILPAGTTPTTTTGSVKETFDAATKGTIPTGWQTWTSGTGGFGVTDAIALSPTNAFASTGGSTTVSRAWMQTGLPADVDASTAVYLDSLIPARLFVRGSNLNTTTPTYYAASVTRGLGVSLIRSVNGVETSLGSLSSANYVSSKWVNVRLVAEGSLLRVMISRPDTNQWLSADGTWSDLPDIALEVQDTGITAAGSVGIGRMGPYSGTVTFDNFSAQAAGTVTGPAVTVGPVSGTSPFAGEVTFNATATGSPTRIEFRLNNLVRATSATSPASWTLDTTTLSNGTYTLTVRAYDSAGNIGSKDYTFTTSNPNATPIPTPTIPKHYSWIRIAELAYSGNPMGTFEQSLLRNSVDLVVPNTKYLSTINTVAPNTPQMIYSNVTNLYQGLLTDWLAYADKLGVSRELAFYHVTKATAFKGNSPSSQPVNWFWGVYQTSPTGTTTNLTSAARGGQITNMTLGGSGTTTAVGYTEKFRTMAVTIATAAATGYAGTWEYVSAVDSTGKPTAWKPLTLLKETTNGMKQSGSVTFDPPADWVTSTVAGSDRLYNVRFRVTAGTGSQSPAIKTILGRDYVGANGTDAGTIPAFDYSADANGDGYLNDAEFANRKTGMDARFVYESRLFYPYYGQMRFVVNPGASAVRKWAGDYHVRVLNANPLADGIFMDNETGKLPFPGVSVLEPTATYGIDSGSLLTSISRAIAPKWVLANTAGGGVDGNVVATGAAGSFEEFLLRPLQANWSEVGDVANLVSARLSGGSPYLVLDSHPGGGLPTDSRMQLATLAYYYLLADPDKTFLMFNGGYNPSSTWTEHWSQAVTVNVGTPTGGMTLFASGADPSNAALTYKVFARQYTNALMLYKPLSYATGSAEGTTAANTATTHQLGGNYRQVNADGTLGAIITSITLMNGQGAVLIKA